MKETDERKISEPIQKANAQMGLTPAEEPHFQRSPASRINIERTSRKHHVKAIRMDNLKIEETIQKLLKRGGHSIK